MRVYPRYPISDMKNPHPIRSRYPIFRTLCRRNKEWEIMLTSFWCTLMIWGSSLEMTLQMGNCKREFKKDVYERFWTIPFAYPLQSIVIDGRGIRVSFSSFWVRKIVIHRRGEVVWPIKMLRCWSLFLLHPPAQGNQGKRPNPLDAEQF